MQIKNLSIKITSDVLNESLAQQFGYRLSLHKFNENQLIQAQRSLAEKISNFEKTNSYTAVHENHEYQKTRAMLNVINQEISERTLTPDEKKKREKYVKGMKKARGEFKKRYGKKSDEVMYATASKMAKKESVDEAMSVLQQVLSERVIFEGEEEKAAVIMSTRDMVDRITGWLEDVASMKAETMLDLVDSIRDELGLEVSQQFNDTVKPALEALYDSLETHRMTLAQAVSILTGEEGPQGSPPGAETMGATPPATGEPEFGDEFGASAAATGGVEAAGRAKRESIERRFNSKNILNSKKK